MKMDFIIVDIGDHDRRYWAKDALIGAKVIVPFGINSLRKSDYDNGFLSGTLKFPYRLSREVRNIVGYKYFNTTFRSIKLREVEE
jgi:hypothetical protein